jgi:hypothetical protein
MARPTSAANGDTELEDLQRKFNLLGKLILTLEGDRKAYYQQTMLAKQRNREAI